MVVQRYEISLQVNMAVQSSVLLKNQYGNINFYCKYTLPCKCGVAQ